MLGRRILVLVLVLVLGAAAVPGPAGASRLALFQAPGEERPRAQARSSPEETRRRFLEADREGPFEVPPATYFLDSDLTVASDVRFAPGATLVLLPGAKLRVRGDLTGAPSRIFSGSLAPGNVRLEGQRSPVHAEWWGAKPDGTQDSLPAFQAAHDSVPNGGILKALSGTYRFGPGPGLALSNRVDLLCDTWSTTFRPAPGSSDYMVRITSPHVKLRGCAFRDPDGVNRANGIHVDSDGLTELSELRVTNFETGLRVLRGNADRFERLRIEGCHSVCVHTGGVLGKQLGDTTWNELVLIPRHPTGTAWLMDGGVNAQYRSRIETVGGAYGERIAMTGNERRGNLPPGEHPWSRPQNIWCWNCNLDAAEQAQVLIEAGWQINYVNTNASGTKSGPGVVIAPKNPSDVDGVTLANMQIASNGHQGVFWRGGRNLQIAGGHIYSNGRLGRYAAVEVGPDAQGLFHMTGVAAGASRVAEGGWGNVRAVQAYGVLFRPGALRDAPALSPDPLSAGMTPPTTRPPALGRAYVVGNMLGGNDIAAISGRPAPAGNRSILGPNMVD